MSLRSTGVCAALLVALVAGCAGRGIRQEPLDKGVFRSFEQPIEQVITIARDALAYYGFDSQSLEATESAAVMLIATTSDNDPYSEGYGEVVRVVIAPESADRVMVRVLTRHRPGQPVLNATDEIFGRRDRQATIDQQVLAEIRIRLEGGSLL